MNAITQDLEIKHKAIKKEIKTQRKDSKIMWRELKKLRAYQGLANPEQKEYTDELTAEFVKNETHLKNLHQKINRAWFSTDHQPDYASGIIIGIFLLVFVGGSFFALLTACFHFLANL